MHDGEQEQKIPLGSKNSHTIGVLNAIAAYFMWGILPVYWKLLEHVPAAQILAHRIFWSFLFVALLLTVLKRWGKFKEVFADKKGLAAIVISGYILSANWFTYIWAVNHDRVIEASLGYYINPLLTIFLGRVVLKEHLNFLQWGAVGLAVAGVLIQTLEFGQVPWIALILASTFAVYGLIKKMVKADSITGLALETLAVTPLALGYIIFVQVNGTGVLGTISWVSFALLIGTGVITALPLLTFGFATKRVPLSTVGFIQYLAPTLSLILGVFAYKEEFTSTHALSFAFIWVAVLLYSISNTPKLAAWKPKVFKVREKSA